MSKYNVEAIYQQGLERVATEPEPAGQKFPCGSRVQIFGRSATVEYVYAHAYGGDNVADYRLDVDGIGAVAWYREAMLTPVAS